MAKGGKRNREGGGKIARMRECMMACLRGWRNARHKRYARPGLKSAAGWGIVVHSDWHPPA